MIGGSGNGARPVMRCQADSTNSNTLEQVEDERHEEWHSEIVIHRPGRNLERGAGDHRSDGHPQRIRREGYHHGESGGDERSRPFYGPGAVSPTMFPYRTTN